MSSDLKAINTCRESSCLPVFLSLAPLLPASPPSLNSMGSPAALIISSVFMFSFLLFALYIDSTFNPLNRSKKYLRSRTLNWLLLGVLYISYYIGRYNMSVTNNEDVRATLNATKTEYGLTLTLGHFTYAIFMLVHGRTADKIGGKSAILVGAVGSALINGLSAVFYYTKQQNILSLTLFNILNMCFQPLGSLCVVKINTNWFEKEERGVFSGVFGVLIGLGTFTALVGGGAIINEFPFWVVFAKPAVLLLLAASVVFVFVEENPPGEKGVTEEERGHLKSKKPTVKKPTAYGDSFAVSMQRVLSLPAFKYLLVTICCVGWVREGLLSWYTSYLEDVHGVKVGTTLFTICSTGITFGGMVGSLGGGWVSDRFFGSKRMQVVWVFFCVEVVAIGVFSVVENVYVACGCICVIASCLFGSLTLIIGSAGADFAGKKDSGVAAGVLNFSQYISSGCSSFVIGAAVETYGWGGWCWSLLPAGIIGGLAAAVLHFGRYKGREEMDKEKGGGGLELVEGGGEDEKVI